MIFEIHTDKVRSLARSFKFAVRGVLYCIRCERNMRIHLTAAAYVLAFSCFYHFSATEYAVLLISICLVLCAETVNTAIEAVVDLRTQYYERLARIAKDCAAGAVFICAVFAAVIGFMFYIKPRVISEIFHFLITNYIWGGVFVLSIPASLLFIFYYPFQLKKQIRRIKSGR